LDLFTLRHSVCSFFCFGSLVVDPVGGALNYVIALLLPPIAYPVYHFLGSELSFVSV
jgi:hypothetical protein